MRILSYATFVAILNRSGTRTVCIGSSWWLVCRFVYRRVCRKGKGDGSFGAGLVAALIGLVLCVRHVGVCGSLDGG